MILLINLAWCSLDSRDPYNLLRQKSRFISMKNLDFSPFFLVSRQQSTSSLENLFIIINTQHNVKRKENIPVDAVLLQRANKQTRPLVKGDHIFRLNDLFGCFIGLLGNYCSRSVFLLLFLQLAEEVANNHIDGGYLIFILNLVYVLIVFVLINLFSIFIYQEGLDVVF